MFQDLNSYLEDRVYLAGHHLTLADALLYYGLHRFFVSPREWAQSFLLAEGTVGWREGV